ncbi:MAG: hypothetical protein ACOX2O_07770 [Bdellovibrionota bacterium]|jgi:hypothetical protein
MNDRLTANNLTDPTVNKGAHLSHAADITEENIETSLADINGARKRQKAPSPKALDQSLITNILEKQLRGKIDDQKLNNLIDVMNKKPQAADEILGAIYSFKDTESRMLILQTLSEYATQTKNEFLLKIVELAYKLEARAAQATAEILSKFYDNETFDHETISKNTEIKDKIQQIFLLIDHKDSFVDVVSKIYEVLEETCRTIAEHKAKEEEKAKQKEEEEAFRKDDLLAHRVDRIQNNFDPNVINNAAVEEVLRRFIHDRNFIIDDYGISYTQIYYAIRNAQKFYGENLRENRNKNSYNPTLVA